MVVGGVGEADVYASSRILWMVGLVVEAPLEPLLLLLVATTTAVAAAGEEGVGEGAGPTAEVGRCTTDTTCGAGEGDFFDRFNGCWHGSREVMVVVLGLAGLPMSTLSSRSRGEGEAGGGAGEVIVECGDWK